MSETETEYTFECTECPVKLSHAISGPPLSDGAPEWFVREVAQHTASHAVLPTINVQAKFGGLT